MYNRKEKGFIEKHWDVIGIRYIRTSPRATVCRIIPSLLSLAEDAYGVAIRTKTDKEDPELARSLAFKRAVKMYLRNKRRSK